MNKQSTYWVYILECENGSFYTGYTRDIKARYLQHISGKGGAKYTRANKPVRIVCCWQLEGCSGTAMKVEYFIKSKSRREKEHIVENPESLKLLALDDAGIDADLIVFDHEHINKEVASADRL